MLTYAIVILCSFTIVLCVDAFLNAVEEIVCKRRAPLMVFVNVCIQCGAQHHRNDPFCCDECYETCMIPYAEQANAELAVMRAAVADDSVVDRAIADAARGDCDALFALNEDGQLTDQERERVESAIQHREDAAAAHNAAMDAAVGVDEDIAVEGEPFFDAASSSGDDHADERMESAIEVSFDNLDTFLAQADAVLDESLDEQDFCALTHSIVLSYQLSLCATCGSYTGRRDPTVHFCCSSCAESYPPLSVMVMERDQDDTRAAITYVTTNAWDRMHRQHSVLDAGATQRRAPTQEEERMVDVNVDAWCQY